TPAASCALLPFLVFRVSLIGAFQPAALVIYNGNTSCVPSGAVRRRGSLAKSSPPRPSRLRKRKMPAAERRRAQTSVTRISAIARRAAGCMPEKKALRLFPLLRPRASDAVVHEAKLCHLVGTIDVAQVDQHGLLHHGLDAIEIESAELLPLGHDHQ